MISSIFMLIAINMKQKLCLPALAPCWSAPASSSASFCRLTRTSLSVCRRPSFLPFCWRPRRRRPSTARYTVATLSRRGYGGHPVKYTLTLDSATYNWCTPVMECSGQRQCGGGSEILRWPLSQTQPLVALRMSLSRTILLTISCRVL